MKTVALALLALVVACHEAVKPEEKPAAEARAAADAGAAAIPDAGVATPGADGGSPAQAAAPKPLPGEEAALGAQPGLLPLSAFDAPVARIEKLPNGLQVWLIERKGDGIESITLLSRGGGATDPQGKPGAASLTAALMETGAAGRSQTQLAAEADAIGAALSVGASQEALAVSASAMATQLQGMVKLLSDVALRPTLAEAEFARVQKQREAALLAQRAEPGVGAQLAFQSAVYGQNLLSRPVSGTLASVKAMKLADVKAFYNTLTPSRAVLVAVGGAKADDVLSSLRKAFGGWKGGGGKLAAPPDAHVPAERPRLVLVDFPGKPQSVLLVGQPSVPRSSPDYLALEALNSVLGGSFTSRLNQNLREVHGYSYGAGSRFSFGLGPGAFVASSSVKTDVTGAAVGEMLKEIERATNEPLTQEELDKARALISYRLVETLSHADSLSRAIAQSWLYGLPPDEYRSWVPRLRALTPQTVQAAVKRALDPAHLTITIAGDKAKVLPQLAGLSLPAPQLRDAEGALAKQ